MSARIMIIGAGSAAGNGYESILRREGFHVLYGDSRRNLLDIVSKEAPDLMIVNVHSPDVRGQEICQMIRQTPEVHAIPLLVISGDDVHGLSTRCLNNGADGYLAKPVDDEELVAHVRAILRRPRNYLSSDAVIQKSRIIIRLGERRVLIDNQDIEHLTPKEYDLLLEIVARSPRIVEKEALVMKIWGIPLENLGRKSLDVHIQRLRRKLGSTGASFLKTVSLVGYQWLDTLPS